MGLFVDILRLPLPFPEIAWLFMAFDLDVEVLWLALGGF